MTEECLRFTNGFRWTKWIFAFIGVFALIDVLAWENLTNNITGLIAYTFLFFLLNRSRRIFYDSRKIYIISGKQEKEISLRTVKRLKKVGVK